MEYRPYTLTDEDQRIRTDVAYRMSGGGPIGRALDLATTAQNHAAARESLTFAHTCDAMVERAAVGGLPLDYLSNDDLRAVIAAEDGDVETYYLSHAELVFLLAVILGEREQIA
jgi:hypothetical protein